MIIIEVWLHGKPGWALPIDGRNRINPIVIKEYADALKEHLHNVARTIHKLQKSGWELVDTGASLYALEYSKSGLNKENINFELEKAGLNSYEVAIRELVENE